MARLSVEVPTSDEDDELTDDESDAGEPESTGDDMSDSAISVKTMPEYAPTTADPSNY
jgi:hypothetical protein